MTDDIQRTTGWTHETKKCQIRVKLLVLFKETKKKLLRKHVWNYDLYERKQNFRIDALSF